MANEKEFVVDANITAIAIFTPVVLPSGVCQADGDCLSGYKCDTSNPTFPTGDLSDPYGVCILTTSDTKSPITVVVDPKTQLFDEIGNTIFQGAIISRTVPNAVATWRSSNPSVVTVSGPTAIPTGTVTSGYGVVTQLTTTGLGRATVTVTYQEVSDTVAVTVGTPYRICGQPTEQFTIGEVNLPNYTLSNDASGVCYTPTPQNYSVSAVASPPAKGTATITNNNQTIVNNTAVPKDTELTFTASPNNNYKFVNWTSANNTTLNNNTNVEVVVPVTGPITAVANFNDVVVTPLTFEIFLTKNNTGGSVSGTSQTTTLPSTTISTKSSETVTITAVPNATHNFVGWFISNQASAFYTTRTQTFIAGALLDTQADVTLEARFTEKTCTKTAPALREFIECNGTTGIYSDGCNGTESRPNDDGCLCISNEVFSRCDGTTGIYIDECGIRNDVRKSNDARCEDTCTRYNTFTSCNGTTGIYSDGCGGIVSQVNDSRCVRWRDCVSGELFPGVPTDRREITYTGVGGGTCWEPNTTVTFTPSLTNALTFQYQRGAVQQPSTQTITATNTSTTATYNLQITTNTDIVIEPIAFVIPPRGSIPFTIQVTPKLLNELADGTSNLRMSVNIREL